MAQILLVALIIDRRVYSEETFSIKDTTWNTSIWRCMLYIIRHLRWYTTHDNYIRIISVMKFRNCTVIRNISWIIARNMKVTNLGSKQSVVSRAEIASQI
jgi:hypothetical protein